MSSNCNFLTVDNGRRGMAPDESGVWSPDGGSSSRSRPSSSDDNELHMNSVPLPRPPSGPGLQTGIVEKIFATYGFIVCPNGARYFFHFGTCVTKPEYLVTGDEVDFMLGPDKKSGRVHAQRVYRHPKEGEASVEPRIPYSSFTKQWLSSNGKNVNVGGILAQSPLLLPQAPIGCPMSAPPMSRQCFSFEHAAIMQCERERGSGTVVTVLPDGSLIIEMMDHTRLVLAQSKDVALEKFEPGNEVAMDMLASYHGQLTVENVRKLTKGTLTADFVRGGEKLYGRVVKEIVLGTENSQIAGLVETSRKVGEEGSVRRYSFTLSSLGYLGEFRQLVVGSSVSFHVQAEGSERRAVALRPISGGPVQPVMGMFDMGGAFSCPMGMRSRSAYWSSPSRISRILEEESPQTPL